MQDKKGFFCSCLIPTIIIAFIFLPLQGGGMNSARSASNDEIAQQVTFVPQVTPFVYPTLSPREIATAAYLHGPVEYEKGAFYSPTYKWVSCGAYPKYTNQTCYELCYGGKCYFVSDKDSRVSLYISLVDERENRIGDLENLKNERWSRVLKTTGDCIKAGGSGVLVFTFYVALADPEPTSKGIATILTAVGAGIVCGGTIWGAISKEGEKKLIINDIDSATITAIDIFLDIEKYPSE